MNILIIGHARHGKDTFAGILKALYGFKFMGSSEAAAEIFIYDALKDKYGYTSPTQCFEDRVNHRAEWYDLICDYNAFNPARLAKEILKTSSIYVGMRSNVEVDECVKQNLFDLIIGVYNPNMLEEPKDSFNINIWEKSDIIIPNAGNVADLWYKATKLRLK